MNEAISVVIPTYLRSEQIRPLIETMARQSLQPLEVIIIDAAPPTDRETEYAVKTLRSHELAFDLVYLRVEVPCTGAQRNLGIDHARGNYIAFIDDDIRLAPDFFEQIQRVFAGDTSKMTGGVCGVIDKSNSNHKILARWKLYRKLGLFSTYEPGHYDRHNGVPINTYLDAPFEGVKEVDWLSGGYTVWRREVFANGLRFSSFFKGGGPLEDVHLALRAAADWKLLKCGSAHCKHLNAPSGRSGRWIVGYRAIRNSWYIYQDIVNERSLADNCRFWGVKLIGSLVILAGAIRYQNLGHFTEFLGRLCGIVCEPFRNS